MSILQVRNSLFTNESIQYLLRSYEIGEIKKCNLFIRGLNDTYKVVTEENQYIYRIYRSGWRNQSDILYELDAIKHLAENGCDVSTPIKKVDDQWLSEILSPEGLRYGVLFSFTKGRHPDINNENCYLIGKALANIHKLSDSFNSTHKRQFELDMQHLAHEPMSLIIPTSM